jgi:hypothetical protein
MNRALDILFVFACAAVLVTAVARSHSSSSRPPSPGLPSPFDRNARVDSVVPGNYAAYERTFLLIVNSGCEFCTASMPLYRRLVEAAAGCPEINMRFVSSEAPYTTHSYLAAHGFPNADVLSVSRTALRGTRYPTMLVANSSARIITLWQGTLTAQGEAAALQLATCTLPSISEDQ